MAVIGRSFGAIADGGVGRPVAGDEYGEWGSDACFQRKETPSGESGKAIRLKFN